MPSRRSTKRKNDASVSNEAPKRHSIHRSAVVDLKPDDSLLLESGIVLACGSNEAGQLALNLDIPESASPKIVQDLEDIVDISAGGMHTLCLNKSGKVYSWGCEDDGVLGRESNEENSHIPDVVDSINEVVVQISAGDSHSAALTKSGKVYAWGSFRDSHGNMGLTVDGGIQKVPVVLIKEGAAKIVSGADHLLILLSNGDLYSLGRAEHGQLGRISSRFSDRESRRGLGNLLNASQIHVHHRAKFSNVWAGSYNSFVKEHNSGKIFSCGLNNYRQLGLNGSDTYTWPVPNPSFNNAAEHDWRSISGGQHHTLALDSTGRTFVLGRKEYGRLGLGDDCDNAEELTSIPTLQDRNVVNISCGESVSYAVTDDGSAYSWGMGSSLMLGHKEDDDVFVPTLIQRLTNKKILKVSCGGLHTVFLAQNPDQETKSSAT